MSVSHNAVKTFLLSAMPERKIFAPSFGNAPLSVEYAEPGGRDGGADIIFPRIGKGDEAGRPGDPGNMDTVPELVTFVVRFACGITLIDAVPRLTGTVSGEQFGTFITLVGGTLKNFSAVTGALPVKIRIKQFIPTASLTADKRSKGMIITISKISHAHLLQIA